MLVARINGRIGPTSEPLYVGFADKSYSIDISQSPSSTTLQSPTATSSVGPTVKPTDGVTG